MQAEHKIQSGSGPLDMRLVQVPKMLLMLRKDWAPMAFCISFKVRYEASASSSFFVIDPIHLSFIFSRVLIAVRG